MYSVKNSVAYIVIFLTIWKTAPFSDLQRLLNTLG